MKKNTILKTLSSAIALSFLLNTTPILADGSIKPPTVVIDAKKIDFSKYNQDPIIDNGTTYVPLRSVFEAMDIDIDTTYWNSAGTITTAKMVNGSNVVFEINKPEAGKDATFTVVVTKPDTKHNTISKYSLEGNYKLIDGRLLVPLRIVSEAYGAKVSYDQFTKTIVIDNSILNVNIPKNAEIIVETFDYTKQYLDQINEFRASEGLPPYTLNAELSAVAKSKAEDFKENNYLNHDSPIYGLPTKHVRTITKDDSWVIGENFSKTDLSDRSVKLIDEFLRPGDNRKNVLSTKYDQIGIGYTLDDNNTLYTVHFYGWQQK